MINYFFFLVAILFAYMNFWFIVSVIKKRNDVADIAWGIGFVLLSWVSFFISKEMELRSLFVTVLVSVWGIRLAWHIYKRNKGKEEDYRYMAWRKEWGTKFYPISYLKVYMLQGLFLFIISFPVLLINKNGSAPISLMDLFGLLIWLTGFFFEVLGDWQLAQFKKNPDNKGKLMTTGLWQYTRHPNYFGEITQWWGIWLIALAVPHGFLSIIGPLTIYLLIIKVSGIPMLEKKMEKHPSFSEYKSRVNMLFPFVPRKKQK